MAQTGKWLWKFLTYPPHIQGRCYWRQTQQARAKRRYRHTTLQCHNINNKNTPYFQRHLASNTCSWIAVLRTALFWAITQQIVVISCRRFGTTYWSQLQGSSTYHASPSYSKRNNFVPNRRHLILQHRNSLSCLLPHVTENSRRHNDM